MKTLDHLEQLAKAVYSPTKDDWELKQALYAFDKAANPDTILAMIALLRQMREALECGYTSPQRDYKRWEALSAFDAFNGE